MGMGKVRGWGKRKTGMGKKVKNRGTGKFFLNFAPEMLENILRSHIFAKIDLLRC